MIVIVKSFVMNFLFTFYFIFLYVRLPYTRIVFDSLISYAFRTIAPRDPQHPSSKNDTHAQHAVQIRNSTSHKGPRPHSPLQWPVSRNDLNSSRLPPPPLHPTASDIEHNQFCVYLMRCEMHGIPCTTRASQF